MTSDQSKFSFALAHIDATNPGEIADLISNPPDKDRYETLRTEMVRRLSMTRSNQMQQLFEREEIGDRTPSQLLRHMRKLAGESVTDEFLKTMWLSRLSQAIRTVTSALDVPLDQLATAADKINDTMPKAAALCANTDRTQENVLQIATTSRDPEKDEMRWEWREFCSQMTKIMKAFARTSVRQTARARSKSRQRRRSKSSAVSQPLLIPLNLWRQID